MELSEAGGSSSTSEINDICLVSGENRNAYQVRCPQCGSLILSPSIATYCPEKPYPLPLCRQKKDGVSVEKERIDSWWRVEKMLDFDNIGFTHASEGVKYLVCADCEMGPVGYLSLESQAHYIAISRVTHGNQLPQSDDSLRLVDGDTLEVENAAES